MQNDATTNWQVQLKNGLRTAEDLVNHGFIPAAEKSRYEQVIQKYQFFLTPYYASLIDKNNAHCPIRKQAIPDPIELEAKKFLLKDPLLDLTHQPAPRLTHRYFGRVLLHLTSACSMYCRFCFRKSLLNELKTDLFAGQWTQALEYIQSHSDIEEVIFSGGDPLMASSSLLKEVLGRLGTFGNLRRIRFHSRVPVTLPQRMTSDFMELLASSRKTTFLVAHFNHPRELTKLAYDGIKTAQKYFCVLNQSVLLKGVNDEALILKGLFETLGDWQVTPYYLHHPDHSAGTGHFDLEIERGKQIYQQLRTLLPGYLVPRYVLDDASSQYKEFIIG